MSEKKGPSWRVPDRDVLVQKHTRAPSSVPDFITEEGTGRVEGDELKRIRSKRPTGKRLEKLEEFRDRAEAKLSAIEVAVADIRGDQKAQNVALASIQKHVERSDRREDVEFVDAVAARKAKREAVLKVALYIITGGLVGKILHTFGML